MSMPSSKIAATSSATVATSQSKTNSSDRSKSIQSQQSLTISPNSSLNISKCTSPVPSCTTPRHQKQIRVTNPVPGTSKGDSERNEEHLGCLSDPNNSSSCLPLDQTKNYLCSCNPLEDPKPGPSTSAAEFDLEVFDSCSSCSLEDCWGPDCHHSSCETSPIAGSTKTSVLIRSGSRNKSFHRKGNKRQHSGSSASERGNLGGGLNKPSTSTGVFPISPSKPHTSLYRHNIPEHCKLTLGELSDNSSEEDFIMSSPGRAIPTHVGQPYEPTSACPSETEEAGLSDEREDEDVVERNGSLYHKSLQNEYSRQGTVSVPEISNETSMADITHDDVSQLTDGEEEHDDVENHTTSNISHNAELPGGQQMCVERSHAESEIHKKHSGDHCKCCRQNVESSQQLSTAYCVSKHQCHEGIDLSTCHCSQMSTSDNNMKMHDENKAIAHNIVASSILNAEFPSMISVKSTTDYAHEESTNDDALGLDNESEQHEKVPRISTLIEPVNISSEFVNQGPSNTNSMSKHDKDEGATHARKCVTIHQATKGSPVAGTSASGNVVSPRLAHCVCHSHMQHHHHHIHHVPVHPSMSQKEQTQNNEGDLSSREKDSADEEGEPEIELHDDTKKPSASAEASCESGNSKKPSNTTIRGTTQDVMTADNVDEIVQDHDTFGTDENEDSLDSVATLSLNEAVSQEDIELANATSFNFDTQLKPKMELIPSCKSEEEETTIDSNLDTSGGLSGTKRKPDHCAEDASGPSNVKKKRTAIIIRSNSTINRQASSLLSSTPKSAPRNLHTNPISLATKGVSDVNMASTAFDLDDQDHENDVEENEKCEDPSEKEESDDMRTAGRQRCWSAGTLHTEEEICSGTTNTNGTYSSSGKHVKHDSLNIASGLSTCETVAMALPCSISSSKNVFANVQNFCCSGVSCCKNQMQPCPELSSSERNFLSENEEKNIEASSFDAPKPYPIDECTEDDSSPLPSNQPKVEEYDSAENKNSIPLCKLAATLPTFSGGSCQEGLGCSNVSIPLSAHQQLTKLIPDKNYPPDDILDWKDSFSRWSNAKRLLAIDQLISMCEPQQVRHMMAVIEPQFQRDFISLLPKELALYVLSFLKPRDLLNAAQTCRYWRILAEDNLLWREKCREAGLGDSVVEMFSARAKSHCKKISTLSGIDYSSWKLGFMREHNIECNWRVKPIRTTKVLKGHDDHVITCLQFSNNKIVSGSDDNTLKVWNASTGRCLRTLVGHTGGVWSSQMEGNTIISGSTDRSLKVWNAETGECVHTLYGHTSTVRCMHLHNNLVVSGSRDATLRMWDISSGECLHVLMGHVAAVRCVQYDGRLVVSGAYDYMVKVWNPITEECLHTLSGHTNRVYSLQFDGVHVVSGSLDTSIRVWDVETGSCKHALMGHQSLTSGMELKDNILVSGNADSTVKVWDITNGQCLQTLSGPHKHQSAVTCLQFDSKFVVTSSDDGTVKLWDVKTGDFIRDLVALQSGGSGGVVWRIRASPTKLVCAVGSRNGTEETKLLVLDFDAPIEKWKE